jgi:hypothetical protein
MGTSPDGFVSYPRLPVVGLLTKDDTPYIFTDSPSLLEPEYHLHDDMTADYGAVESPKGA